MKVYIISDVHGNIEGLIRALEKNKITDKHGNRQLARKHMVFAIGDLANCVEDSWIGDVACLDMVGEVIDGMIFGNHEWPYLDPGNSFSGFKFIPEIDKKIKSLMAADLVGASIQFDKALITHAGVSKQFISVDNQDNADYFHKKIEDHFHAHNWEHGLFSDCGWHRGGRAKVGGILWCDFNKEFVPTGFPQIVGHTPGGVRFKGNALCIDVGAKKSGRKPFILEMA